MKRTVFLSAVAALLSAPVWAASPAIGVASAVGAFSLNDASITGNADVVDGSQLRTTVAPSNVHLATGVDVRLATRSAGVVFGDHLLLRQGAVRIANFNSYPVQANDLQVHGDTPDAQAIVRISGSTVEVASIGGPVTVTDGGAMLTHVIGGTKMSFQNTTTGNPSGQTGAAPGTTGAAPAPAEKGPVSDKKVILWSAGVCAVGAVVVGALAASEGKSPF